MLDTHLPRAGLIDRGSERDVLDRLIAGVRAGQSPKGVTIQVYRPTGRPQYAPATAD